MGATRSPLIQPRTADAMQATTQIAVKNRILNGLGECIEMDPFNDITPA
jgi:hypothetical protein